VTPLASVAAVFAIAGGVIWAVETPEAAAPRPAPTTVTTEAPQRPLPSPTTSEPGYLGLCPPVYAYALLEGFMPEEAVILDRIAWLESRCSPRIMGDSGQSYGILQIHGPTWCQPSRYWPEGWLQQAGVVEWCDELLDVRTAVEAARRIYLEGGFEQWSTYPEAAS
jgi:hypothetical protein